MFRICSNRHDQFFEKLSEVRMRSILLGLLAGTLLCADCKAQGNKSSGRPADLSLTAVGRQHHPIQTVSASAQDYFDQGITLLYGFNHEEAARAFQRAAELDTQSPMPLWGIAMAVGPNYNADVDAEREKIAFETIEKASKLAEHAPRVEQDYVTTLMLRYSNEAKPDYKKLANIYAMGMRTLSRKYPEDLDAATMYAESLMDLDPWKLWTLDGKPGEHTEEIIRVLESVLTRDPMHAGANHYYIHALEASPNPERALPSAQRLESLIPRAGHLVHMPSHIYARTGDFSHAAERNAKAAQVDKSYAEEADRSGSMYDLMYHSHNEHFLAMAASMEGQYAEAKQAADALSKRLLPHATMMPMLDGFVMTPIWVDARFSKWDAILARPEPPASLAETHLMWRYSRALAFASQHDASKAAAEFAAFEKEEAAIPAAVPFGFQASCNSVHAVALEALAARIAEAQRKPDDTIKHWLAAVAAQDKLSYDEPADWYYPVRESLGAAYMKVAKPYDAEMAFRADLERNPRNPRSLFGLREALAAQHLDTDAAWVDRQFKESWKSADVELKLGDL
jgi:tetratricopeptide (TPR) repeat protein